METIYLDYNATTPVAPEVADAMRPYLETIFGNPSSIHQYGIESKKGIITARKQVADLIGADPSEIIFTSGGTESNNYAIKGIAFANKNKGNHIITSQVEHPAVIEVCKYLETQDFRVTYLSVDEYGMIDVDELKESITDQTILITIMHANNETGTIQPISEISEIAKQNNIFFHTDAAQSLGKIPVDVNELGVDLLSIAGHKLYAPIGIGALYVRSGVELEKLMHGANHERNLRAGTENVLEIAGLGKACELAKNNLSGTVLHLKNLRELLHKSIIDSGLDIKLNGHPEKRLPNTLNISFKNIEANTLLSELNDVAASAGAACHSEGVDVSSVLTAMKIPLDYAMGAVRFSTGKFLTEKDIERAANRIIEVAQKLSGKSELSQTDNKIRLTQYTHGMGCACKLRPQQLEEILKDFPVYKDDNILIGTGNSDDAAVYKINDETAIVQTVDFFTPIVDDPYQFGAIAAANALSDIYAMGAKPLFALNIVGFPSNRLPMSVLNEILNGANDKAKEAGIPILGGHTIEDTEPKYGLVVVGQVHPDKILSNEKACVNDVIILTKPIGTGVLSTAKKRGLISDTEFEEVVSHMVALNKTTTDIMLKYPVSTCTDVTGFGLIGHLREVLKASKVNAEIELEKIPVLNKTKEFISADVIPGGTLDNYEFNKDYCKWEGSISNTDKLLLNDAQTSGGLLIFVNKNEMNKLTSELSENNINTSIIGTITNKGEGRVIVR